MRVVKVLNNSLVLALDEDGRETILMGKGIGFHKAAGYEFQKEEVEKVFGRNMLQDEEMKPLLDQLTGIQEEKPFECVGSRDEINSAIVLTIEQMEKEGKKLPLLFEHYKETGLYERYQTEKNKFSAYFDSSNLVPEPWEKFVRERCTKEA